MDLRHFVRDTIQQIIGGIEDAKTTLAENKNGAINPIFGDQKITEKNILLMEFDVAVTVAESSQSEIGGQAKAGIQVFGAGLNGKQSSSTESSSVSRIKFTVPYIPPSTTVHRDR